MDFFPGQNFSAEDYCEWAPDDIACPLLSDSGSPEYGETRTSDRISALAESAFGIPYLFPWQRLVIANILDAIEAVRAAENKDSDDECYDEDGAHRGRQIILLPTGAGKSLCFQLPALVLDKPTLVIYPLLALMGDQLRRMEENGIRPVLFRGNQNTEERENQYRRLDGRDGQPPANLIIANPEILSVEKILKKIAERGVGHIAVDEAHCVSEWGDSFRPAYLDLKKIIEKLNPPAVTAFTATASPPVLERIAEILFDGRAHIVRGDSDRPNIQYSVIHCFNKPAALIRAVAGNQRPLVVFCSTRGQTERTALLLRETLNDTDIRFYHAGLEKEEKQKIESWFHGHERGILCTTCAWGMGVDKKMSARLFTGIYLPHRKPIFRKQAGADATETGQKPFCSGVKKTGGESKPCLKERNCGQCLLCAMPNQACAEGKYCLTQ
ncbi:DEAD/DEAH box helicase [Brucepastera parasyntrophica]|uniref:DEAD/DEAH box helicase n=1 Tax=Brucepastera parasyntrophica TaxID=2880008 RepID=UPI00210D4123|nr:DEAD/DEAH box helicase [Brucepastera parasyntrophica]ULQ60511.1 DEAD/DEAH box helicase [Brucepastera parasyntrophica]